MNQAGTGTSNLSSLKPSGIELKPPSLELVYSLESSSAEWRQPEFRAAWNQLLRARTNHDAFYQSPEFFEHLHAATTPSTLSLLTVRSPEELVGIVPLRVGRWPLTFEVSGRMLAQTNLRAVIVLGSQPLIPSESVLYDRLFTTIRDAFPDCDAIVMGSVPADSFLWHYCHTSEPIGDHFLVHTPNGKRPCHTMPLPATFDEYLARFNGKQRYNIRRQVRRLQEFGHGSFEFRRITTPADVPMFIDAVSRFKSGAPIRLLKPNTIADLAARGMLLCYLLLCNHRVSAIAIGTRYQSIYRLDVMAYDKSIAALSPGSAMLYLLVEDAIRRQICTIDLGYGEPAYRHHSTNLITYRGSLVLLRRTVANRLRRSAHKTFQYAVARFKQLLRGPAPSERQG
jgi:CelD/BcsL family acetyltransferase involved in cellulose biosynthesis